jgi:hypothetical protein
MVSLCSPCQSAGRSSADGGPRAATYKRIAKVDLRIPPKVSAEARDLITNVRCSCPPPYAILTLPARSYYNMIPRSAWPSRRSVDILG